MKILITGASGFLGKHLSAELLKRGHDVCGVDVSHWPEGKRCDVAEFRQIDDIFFNESPDFCYHLAGEFGRQNGTEFYEQLYRSNIIGTQNVIECCRRWGTKLVFASSSEIYGFKHGDAPLSEFFTQSPVQMNEYALSKWTNEQQIEIARRRWGLKAVVLRFFNVYGPGERYSAYRSAVCQICWKLLHNEPVIAYGDYWRNFLYVTDWAVPVANVAERFDSLKDDVFNIGGPDYASIQNLVSSVEAALGEGFVGNITWGATDPAGVVQHKRPDITRQIEQLGYAPSVKLVEGIPLTLAWMKSLDTAKGES